jgi:predicted Zn-dependent protease
MRITPFLVALPLFGAATAAGQAPLPDLGSAGDAALSPQMERRIGESVMRDIRRDPAYDDDPEVIDYLAGLGAPLARATQGVRQDFQFFLIRDPTINAFALPGGYIGVHSGLLTASETESELASVIGHEIGHVALRHIARGMAQEQQMQAPMMAALLAAVLLARSRPDLATGAAIGAQAGVVQSQLAYSREFEREADRSGMEALAAAGFDPSGMPAFFERLARATRISDDSSVPGYLRTHPLTTERIAAAQARAAALPYRQHLDNPEFQLVRAKVRVETAAEPRDAVSHFDASVRDGRYASEAAARYGLASALLRARRPRDAEAEVARLRATGLEDPMIETLAAKVKHALGQNGEALALLTKARARYPYARAVVYVYVAALLEGGGGKEALSALEDPVRQYPRDATLRQLQAKTYAALGKRLLQHQAQAEVYAIQGSLPAAIEQLQLARSSGDGDFYQLSVVDARLKELRAQHEAEVRDAKR